MLNWNTSDTFSSLKTQSLEQNKPILLDIYSDQCEGSKNLNSIYNDAEVAALIQQHTLPLRVVSDTPDRASTAIINDHIYILSPTVQLLAHTGARYHEFNGAPRQTRYSVNYTQTHHELDGNLTKNSFIAQLYVGLGKAKLRNKQYVEAAEIFRKIITEYANDELSVKEAVNLLAIAEDKGTTLKNQRSIPTLDFCVLSKAVERFIRKVVVLSDNYLMSDWTSTQGTGDWQWYTDSLKEVFLQIYQDLCSLAQNILMKRGAPSLVHQILSDFHVSYREFQAVLLNINESYLDVMPYSDYRTLRENVEHCILSEWWAHSPQVRYALELNAKGLAPQLMPANNTFDVHGEQFSVSESLEKLLKHYEHLHNKLIHEFSQIKDSQLSILSKWWEPDPVAIEFRLKRLGWHLRDHKVTLEHILQALEHQRSEIDKFCQLLFHGLAKVESAFIGLDANVEFVDEQQQILNFIDVKTNELEQCGFLPPLQNTVNVFAN